MYHIWVSGIRGKIVLSPQQVVSKCWIVWCAMYIERISVSKIKLAVTSKYFCWTLDQNTCVNLTLVLYEVFFVTRPPRERLLQPPPWMHFYKKHTPKELGWNHCSMKWEQFFTEKSRTRDLIQHSSLWDEIHIIMHNLKT